MKNNWNMYTPITFGKHWKYKREDLFCPYGEGGINGSKLRQVYYLCELAIKQGYKGIISGAVSQSPQHPMVTQISKSYGLSSTIVTGAKKLENYPMLLMAGKLGAEFVYSKVGYAGALNGIAKSISKELGLFHLETNITISGKSQDLYEFHKIGGRQVANLPKKTETIMIPLGSCNSAVSVLVGLAEKPLPNLKEIILFGIGSFGTKKPQYVTDRLKTISETSGIDYDEIYNFKIFKNPSHYDYPSSKKIDVIRYDLNGSGFCNYSDWIPYTQDNIEFHPRYEGKILSYIDKNREIFDDYKNDRNLFWVVGSQPKN